MKAKTEYMLKLLADELVLGGDEEKKLRTKGNSIQFISFPLISPFAGFRTILL